jgi:anti-sigma B factor antagonist
MDVQNCSVSAMPLVLPEIVALPDEIDITNSQRIGDELRAAFRRPDVAAVIADMTRTAFCDSSGIRHLLVANDIAAEVGAELRLVIESGAVLRVLQVTGLDRVLKIYPSLDDALTNAVRAQAVDLAPEIGPVPADNGVQGRSGE